MEHWRYCPECDKETQFIIKKEREEHTIRGERITIDLPFLACSLCGLELFDEELTGGALRAAYDEVRKRKGFPSPDELKAIRKKMDLSQRELAKLLGWSHITIHRYEKGSFPNEAHATVLESLIKNPTYALELLKRNAANFTADEFHKVESKLRRFVTESSGQGSSRGNRPFVIEKLGGMVVFFAQNIPSLFKTKLLKLLWYSDFLHFKRHGCSISGLQYVHHRWGPVPRNYTQLLGQLEGDGVIRIEPTLLGEYEGELIIPLRYDVAKILTGEEQNTINTVLGYFKSWSAKKLSDYSHKEKAYVATEHRDLISYDFAKDLSIN
ncbi:MAG: DUF4065 domain-containing protein [Peptococcaceae bacterium]|nr:DUF4065 domain-containing protein [Peptococcaceae bacterium]